jgi:Patatin-like phospholipase
MTNSTKSVNILAIDGGALRGVIPARILSYLDGSVTNQIIPPIENVPSLQGITHLNSCFSVIGGTSTGGLLAACLSVPTTSTGRGMTGDQALDLYYSKASTIFPLANQNSSPEIKDLVEALFPMFGNSGLASVIAPLYGVPNWANDLSRSPPSGGIIPSFATPAPINPASTAFQTLSDAPNTVLLTSFNANYASNTSNSNSSISIGVQIDSSTTPLGPQLLTNTSKVTNPITGESENLSVLQACLMTSAFPVLLPPVPADLQFGADTSDTGNINYFIDGGVFADNPSLAIYIYCLQNQIQINSFISIGCGFQNPSIPNYSSVKKSGFHNGWDSPLIELLGTEPASLTDQFMSQALPGKYFRLNPTLTDTSAAWSSNTTDLKNWVADTDSYISNLLDSNAAPFNWQDMINVIQQVTQTQE